MIEVIALLLAIPVAILVLACAALVAALAKARATENEMDNAIRAQMLLSAINSADRLAKAEAAALDHDLFRYYVTPGNEEIH
ncbi:hypothetical protein UFOVP464_32 [uncultured Caudovirales phage]|uniref:Uncharacterized protein n=1 Tax=uncultured Caudovirales phage TaxID=2100421 RepID=A0A6J5MG99_9CAUD|nr:hypothetical protein UFOVP464_32 [uncultured Caudovirales phage]CAB4189209.1 hypothetical protein UFOVP1189_8 [uncultured Caudovirales phage]